MEAAAAMDFHALSRRELQALCKRNGVRANMTNAAMVEALQGLTSIDGIDEIGTTLCLPTPGRSAMKSAVKMAELAGEEKQHGSPLPRGRRVSVKSPEAIRMEVEEGEDEMKGDLVKEIVRTPGVALRSTSRCARATPAPLPTPVPASSARAATRRTAARKAEEVAPTPATLRRSQRTAGRKAAAPVEVEQPAGDVSAAKRATRSARSKMTMALDQEEEVATAAPMVNEKVQQEEPKDVASDVKCDDPNEDEVTKLLEGDNEEEQPEEGEEADSSDATIGSAVASDKSRDDTKMEEAVVVMEEEATKPQEGIVEEKEPASVEKPAPLATMEDSPILGVLSKAEASEPVIEKAQDASLEDDEGCAEWSPVTENADEVNGVIADKEVSVDEEAMMENGCTITGETDHSPEEIIPTAAEEDQTSEEEGAADEMPQAGLENDETSKEDEEDDLTELKEGDANEYASTDDDDFSGDLPPEFDNVIFSDSETESDITPPVLEENQAAVASATKPAIKSLDDSAIVEEQEEVDATEKAMKEVDNIVKTLDEFTIKEGEAKEEMQKQLQVEDYDSMSLRKLRSMYKERIIAAKQDGKEKVAEGKRLPLEEVDENACCDC